MNYRTYLLAVLLTLTTFPVCTFARSETDIITAEYKLPASIDESVLKDRKTELWASVTMPNTPGLKPLIVMLHGNHSTCRTPGVPESDASSRKTCTYTSQAKCDDGLEVIPNHRGYDYVAADLAGKGAIVISINANLGITCAGSVAGDSGLIQARGRLVLRHLEELYTWHRDGGAPTSIANDPDIFRGQIDFSRVGFMGHSRGGEGVRSVPALYADADSIWPQKIPGLNIRGVFEIGAVDGQSTRTFNPIGTQWTQILPMCDGDVSDLEGMYPFYRMYQMSKTQTSPIETDQNSKSLLFAYGTNHNFYNTEWTRSDSSGCENHSPIFDINGSGSAEQQLIANKAMQTFFQAALSLTGESLPFFLDPSLPMPPDLQKATQYTRGFVSGFGAKKIGWIVEFPEMPGPPTPVQTSLGQNVTAIGVATRRVAKRFDATNVSTLEMMLEPGQANSNAPQVEIPLAKAGEVFVWPTDQSLDLELFVESKSDVLNLEASLVDANDLAESVTLPALNKKAHRQVNGFQTVRLSRSMFSKIDPAKIKSLRLDFSHVAPDAKVQLASILTTRSGLRVTQDSAHFASRTNRSVVSSLSRSSLAGSKLLDTAVSYGLARRKVHVRLAPTYDVGDSLIELRVGDQTSTFVEFQDPKDPRVVTFVFEQNVGSRADVILGLKGRGMEQVSLGMMP